MTDNSRRTGPSRARAMALRVVSGRTPLLGALVLMLTLLGAATPASAVPTTNPGDKALSTAATMEDFPAAVADPTRTNALAVTFARDGGCFVRASTDSGTTWAAPVRLRASIVGGTCVAADLAYAPDGSRLYAAYAEWGPATSNWQLNRILAAVSTDGGRTWGAPVVVLQGTSDPDGDAYLEPQVATPLRATDAKWVYVTAVQHYRNGAATKFTRSQDFGSTWTVTNTIGIRFRYPDEMLPPLQATRHTLAGGPGGEVMLVNACGGCDDAEYPAGITRDQGVRIWRSATFGAGFSGITKPIYAERGALNYTFPANVAFGWGEAAVGPAVGYGVGGVAHMIYPANGHLYYIWARAPFTTWSEPEQVDDGAAGSKQAPVLQVKACGDTTYLHALWYDTRTDTSDQKYDVFYAQRGAVTDGTWSNNVRVSNATSYPQLPWSATALAVSGGTAFGVWPDRRDNGGYDLDIFGSTIRSGLTCP